MRKSMVKLVSGGVFYDTNNGAVGEGEWTQGRHLFLLFKKLLCFNIMQVNCRKWVDKHVQCSISEIFGKWQMASGTVRS